MDNEKCKGYLIDFIALLKDQALEAKQDADKPEKGKDEFYQGHLMAYYSVVSLLKHQAFTFDLDEKELGLADIDPDTDLLGLHRREE